MNLEVSIYHYKQNNFELLCIQRPIVKQKKVVKLDLNFSDLLRGTRTSNKIKNNVNMFQKNHSTPKGEITT